MSEVISLPVYKSTREAKAFKIGEIIDNPPFKILISKDKKHTVSVNHEYYNKYNPEIGNYYVIWGYKYGPSYSLAKDFEKHYVLKEVILDDSSKEAEEHF